MDEGRRHKRDRWLKSQPARFGLGGALIGLCAPAMYTVVELGVLHSDTSLSAYLKELVTARHDILAAYVFTCGAVLVMGFSGYLVGRHREREQAQRLKVETANRELAALNSVAEIVTKTRELDLILYLVLKETLSLSFLNIEKKGAVFLLDESEPEMLRMAAEVGLSPHLVRQEKYIGFGHCLCGKAVRTGEVVVSTDCFSDPDHTTNYPGMEKHGHVVVPIVSNQAVLGAMTFYLPPDTVPSREDVGLLTAVAGQLAVAVENRSLAQDMTKAKEGLDKKSAELAKNVEALRAMVEVDRIILSNIDRDEMISLVGSQLRQLVAADSGGVVLKEQDSGDFRFIGGWGVDARRNEILLSTGLHIPQELKAGNPLTGADVGKAGRGSPLDRLLTEAGARQYCYVPIMRKRKIAGVIFLGRDGGRAFSKEDADTAMTFASRMGMALEHAKLIRNLEEISVEVVHVLATAIDAKSPWTKGHSERVARYAVNVAENMGVNGSVLERLYLAGLLHDIGKIGTYDVILDKTEKLTEEDMELIKQHPDRGCEILSPIKEFADILPLVRHHHERWDGGGYPLGLKGAEIPLMARVICVADSFDTMTADRPYRCSIGFDNAVEELKYCSGTQFDPDVAAVFLDILKERGPAIIRDKQRTPYSLSGRVFARQPEVRF